MDGAGGIVSRGICSRIVPRAGALSYLSAAEEEEEEEGDRDGHRDGEEEGLLPWGGGYRVRFR